MDSSVAQTISLKTNNRFGAISGEITLGFKKRFEAFIERNPQIIGLTLDSNGGNLYEALRASDVIRSNRISTYVPQDTLCASACTFLFFAGYDRLNHGALGVHQIGGATSGAQLQVAIAEVYDRMQLDDVPDIVFTRMMRWVGNTVDRIDSDEALMLGLNRDQVGDRLSFSSPLPSELTYGEHALSAYPVESFLAGPPSYPDFAQRDKKFAYFRSRITTAVDYAGTNGPNFAGHYQMVVFGCGTSCLVTVLVNLRNGQVINTGYSGEEKYQLSLLFTPDSRMIKFKWAHDDQALCNIHHVVMEHQSLRLIYEGIVQNTSGFCNDALVN